MDMAAFNARVIERFRANRGRGGIEGGLDAGNLLLLTHTGARSGKRRTTPVMFLRLGGRLCVIASNDGAPRHPDWYRNLLAHPAVTVEIADEEFPATAVAHSSGPERDELFAQAVRQRPFFAEHQERAGRTIPVVELRRTDS
ncbi:nitroreductase/quinone reductase family protein [Streptomyces fenghuangensis]|uniref:Nitroreductase/quinone reductase family protein n=1 Tax=Streptomyces chitinivorans TaxID=1257027 RepID=A0ABW7HQN3_9ACTN|nr:MULTISPECIES: nitroreductase/quinone reductase family protein [Streptomyces]MCG3040557.1 nitroreductase family deazaflavin-dependent oxidoreductase [Streptomyces sp. ICN903]MDH2407631.1 nitroreductase/quinone reductase family protein [Streptomyces chitinivorans]